MGNLGCPKCSSTPIIYSVTTRLWSCKRCKHTWTESSGKKVPARAAKAAPKKAGTKAKPKGKSRAKAAGKKVSGKVKKKSAKRR